MIRRCITNNSADGIIPIYTSFIRPILKTNRSALNLTKKRRKCFRTSSKTVRITHALSFIPFSVNIYRADMRETYKRLNNDYTINPKIFFKLRYDNLTHHLKNIHKKKNYSRSAETVFFSNRMVDAWNDLDENIGNAKK